MMLNEPVSNYCKGCGQVNWKLGDFGIDTKGLYATAYCRNTHVRHVDPIRVYIGDVTLYTVGLGKRGDNKE